MKRIMLCIYTCLFLIFISNTLFAYQLSSFERNESTTSSGYSEISNLVYLNQLMDLTNINVKFTQDSNNYIFHITGRAYISVYNGLVRTSYDSAYSQIVPMLYKKENFGNNMYIEERDKMGFSDYRTGNLYTYTTVRILNEVIEYYKYSYTLRSNGDIIENVSDFGNNGDKYFIGNGLRSSGGGDVYNFRRATTYPICMSNNGRGVSLINNSSYHYNTYNGVLYDGVSCVDTYNAFINTKIAINKRYIDDYRYICFAQSYFVNTTQAISNTSDRIRGISICSQTIDLKEYIECNHDWEIRSEDRNSHSRYCNNCEWRITEAHNLLYEYDNIKNNICTCSYIDKVNYTFKINDDYTSEVTKTLDTYSTFEKYEFQEKKGYKFKYYDVYEKRLKSNQNLSTVSNATEIVFIATNSDLPNETKNISMIYEARYEPNKFIINYSNENNMNIKLDGSIDKQIVCYDETAYIKDNIRYTGYAFKGWSLEEKGESIDIVPLQEITNYSDIDMSEFTVYPVYADLNFKIKYSSGQWFFLDGSKYKEVNYTYYDDKELEKITTAGSGEYLVAYTDNSGHKFKSMSDVKKYVNELQRENIVISLSPIFDKSTYAPAERTEDYDKRKGAGAFEIKDDESVEENDKAKYLNPYDDELSIIDYDNMIHGMSDTSKEEIDEQKEDDDKSNELNIATVSFIRKKDFGISKRYSKFDRFVLFIKNNLVLSLVFGALFVVLIIVYEVIIIKYYAVKHYVKKPDEF